MSALAALFLGTDPTRPANNKERSAFFRRRPPFLFYWLGLSFRSTPEAPIVRSTPLDVARMTTFTPF
jgi:hypothetical protein